MYFDKVGSKKREDWLFTYKQSEIFDSANTLLSRITHEESTERRIASAKLSDPKFNVNSEEAKKMNERIHELGRMKEMLEVVCHECKRSPDVERHLTFGDVVFFGLQS